MAKDPLFLLGAGFSAPFGVPTMLPFHSEFCQVAARKYPRLAVTLDEVVTSLGANADLESLLSALNAASSVESGLPMRLAGDAIAAWVTDARALRAHLLAFIVEKCEQFDRALASKLVAPFCRAATESASTVLTTNYDRIFEYGCEVAGVEASDGFDGPLGGPPARWTANFDGPLRIVKLHGSVTWYVEPGTPETFLRFDRGYALPGEEFHLARQDAALEPLMIIPTLEKAALAEPYSHLLNLFGDLLDNASCLVIIGSSLRDDHLANSINYHGGSLAVLLVSPSASSTASRLRAPTVALETDTQSFLETSMPSLMRLLDTELGSQEEVLEALGDFAVRQKQAIADRTALSPEQRDALANIAGGDNAATLEELQILRGVGTSEAIAVFITALGSTDASVRSTAAGCLGVAQTTEGLGALGATAESDVDPGVQLEATLAIARIPGREAEEALETVLRSDDGSLTELVTRLRVDQ